MDRTNINWRDLGSGGFFIFVGLFYGSIAMETLDMGRAQEMGPGYFPIVLSGILIVLGLVIGARSFVHVSDTPFGKVPWRAILMITIATALFAAFLDNLGMLPAVFLSAFICCMASDQISYLRAALIGIGLAAICVLVFAYGVKLPIPVFGTWFVS